MVLKSRKEEYSFLPSSSDHELLNLPIPEELFAKEWECPREEYVPSCTKLCTLRTWLQEWTAVVPKGPWSFSCVLPDRFKKDRANQTKDTDAQVACTLARRWQCMLPARLLLYWVRFPSSLTAQVLQEVKGPHAAVQPSPQTLSISAVQHVARPVDSPASINTGETEITGYMCVINHWPRWWLFFFFPYNLTSRSTEQRKGMETLGIHCVAWYSFAH